MYVIYLYVCCGTTLLISVFLRRLSRVISRYLGCTITLPKAGQNGFQTPHMKTSDSEYLNSIHEDIRLYLINANYLKASCATRYTAKSFANVQLTDSKRTSDIQTANGYKSARARVRTLEQQTDSKRTSKIFVNRLTSVSFCCVLQVELVGTGT